jgi:hypothetical protein
MSDLESESELSHIDESMKQIHDYVEKIAHDSKHLYSKALKFNQLIENPEMDIWAETFKLHERARGWAKKHMVASRCSLWEVNKTLIEVCRKEDRIKSDGVQLNELEGQILGLSHTEIVHIWQILARLPRFFL